MNNYFNPYTYQGRTSYENLENMYPEIYTQAYPTIVNIADGMRRSGYQLTNDVIDTSVDHAIKMSGMWEEDAETNYDVTYPVQVGFGRPSFRRGRRGFHNRNTLRDLFRILLLRELLR